jgi:hypothetical protein
VLSRRTVESIRRCPACGIRALVVVARGDAAARRATRRRAMATVTRSLELRLEAQLLTERTAALDEDARRTAAGRDRVLRTFAGPR